MPFDRPADAATLVKMTGSGGSGARATVTASAPLHRRAALIGSARVRVGAT
jgi:hypothetical protein